MSFSSAERARLAALFHKLGPDAPTLCEGWTTRDLAAHLWVRENRLDAAAGMFIPQLKSRLEAATQQALARDYDELVDDWGSGPGKSSPLRIFDAQANAAEHYIHVEDVRRANGLTEPRDFSAVTREKLYKILKMLGPRMLSRSSAPVVLVPEGFPRVVAADKRGVSMDGGNVVRVVGSAPELLLWVYGRDAAHVSVEGPREAIRRSSL